MPRLRHAKRRARAKVCAWGGGGGGGCIVSPEISVLHLVVLTDGGTAYPGLNDRQVARRLGPKRASKIRRLFNLSNKDDVRKYVIRRSINKNDENSKSKAPKIQRLVTPITIQRKRRARRAKIDAQKASREAAKAYETLLATRASEARAMRRASEKKRSEEAKKTVKP